MISLCNAMQGFLGSGTLLRFRECSFQHFKPAPILVAKWLLNQVECFSEVEAIYSQIMYNVHGHCGVLTVLHYDHSTFHHYIPAPMLVVNCSIMQSEVDTVLLIL